MYRSPFFNFRDYIECDGGKVHDRYTEWFPDDKEAEHQSNVLLAYKLMFGVHVDPEFRHISWNYYEEELHRGNQEAFEKSSLNTKWLNDQEMLFTFDKLYSGFVEKLWKNKYKIAAAAVVYNQIKKDRKK